MRIEQLHVYGFGEWQDVTWEFSEGLNLVEGPNETGKTTLMAFIRAVLFGFENRKAMHERYEPRGGGRFGGALTLCDGEGMRYRVERVGAGRSAGKVQVDLPDGSSAGEEKLALLLGRIDEKVFKNLFAFGLSELQQLETLQQEEVNSFLYHAGTGSAAQLLRAQKQLQEQEIDLFRPSAQKPRINQTLRKLDELQKELHELKASNQTFNQLVRDMEELEERIDRLQLQTDELTRTLRWQELLVEQQGMYQAWVEVSQRLQALPELAHFPEEGLGRLERCLEKLRELRAEQEALQEEQRGFMSQLAHFAPAPAWLEADKEVAVLREQLPLYQERAEMLKEKRLRLKALEEELQALVGRVGAAWTTERMEAFDTSLAQYEVVQEKSEQLQKLKIQAETLRKQEEALQEKERQLQEEEKQLQAWRKRLPQTWSEEERRKRGAVIDWLKKALPHSAHLMERVKEAEVRIARDEGTLAALSARVQEQEAKRRQKNRPRWLLIVSAVLITGISLILWFQDQPLAAVLFFGGMGFAVYSLWAKQHSGLDETQEGVLSVQFRPLEQGLSAERGMLQQLKVEMRRLKEEAEVRLVPFQLSFGQEAVLFLEREWAQEEEYRRQKAQWEEAWRKVQLAKSEWEEKRQRWKLAQEEYLKGQTEWQESWVNWLTAQGLDERLWPETAKQMLQLLTEGKERVRQKRQIQQEIAQLEESLSGYESRVRKLFAQTYIEKEKVDHADEEDEIQKHKNDMQTEAQMWELSEQVQLMATKVQEAQERERVRLVVQEKCQTLESRLKELQKRIQGYRQEEEALYHQARVSDEETFRTRARQVQEREAAIREKQHLMLSLQRVLGGEERMARFFKAMKRSTPGELKRDLEGLTAKKKQEEAQLNALIELKGRLQQQISDLKQDERLSYAQQRFEKLKAQLKEEADEWAVTVLAQQFLRQTMQMYEEHKQPEVIKRTAFFFQHLTGGRYTNVYIPIGEKRIEVERKDGLRLEPAYLSRGTVEQLYLAMRFALVEAYRKHVVLPFVLDDILVNFDPERARAALYTLEKLAREQQVIFFTCHPHFAGLCDALRLNYRKTELSRPKYQFAAG